MNESKCAAKNDFGNTTPNELILNIEKIHTTPLGAERIKRNLALLYESEGEVIAFCKDCILRNDSHIERRGKNWYVTVDGMTFTVNAYSFTVITAHKTR